MSKNFVCHGRTLDFKSTESALVPSGSVVALETMIGVAETDLQPGKAGVLNVEGVFRLPTESTADLKLGADCFWDTDKKQIVSAAAATAVPAGTVWAAAGNGTTIAQIKINA